MHRLLLAAALLASSLGSKPALAERPAGDEYVRLDPAGAPESAKLSGYALVWIDAAFYLSPADDAQVVSAARLTARKGKAGYAIVVRVVGVRGSFVEVETLDERVHGWETHCAVYYPQFSPVTKVRLFVKRADLAPVVSRAHTVKLADGATLALEPGVPVERLVDGRVLVDLHGTPVPIAVPQTLIGYSYATKPRGYVYVAGNYELTAKEITVGSAIVRLPSVSRADKVTRKNGRTAFPVEGTCVRATVLVPDAEVRELTEDRDVAKTASLLGFGLAGHPERWVLPAETKVTADTGKATAILIEAAEVGRPAKGDKLACTTTTLGVAAHRKLAIAPTMTDATIRWCGPAKAVVHQKAKSSPFDDLGEDIGFGPGRPTGVGPGVGTGIGPTTSSPNNAPRK